MVELLKLREHEDMVREAAKWFHQKWGIPLEAYQESMEACLCREKPVPQWYLAMSEDTIAGGMGVIENDFHDRKDLTPNVCAVYVEKEYRGQGIAGKLLELVCDDMKSQDIGILYLVTDHTSFYERYGWEFLCMVQGVDETEQSRMYVHRQ